MTALWDTTGTAVVRALAAARHQSGAVSSGLALTLIAATEGSLVAEAEQAATAAAAQHPCRLLLVVRHALEAPTSRLDAEVSVGGRLGPGEAVLLHLYGRLTLHAESVVLPLLAADAPVVTWWYGPPPTLIERDPLGCVADRRITDSSRAADPLASLLARALDFAPGDTDLAWTRTTLWRSLCASAFESMAGPIVEVAVAGEAGNPSLALLAGWLKARLRVPVSVQVSPGPGVTEVRLRVGDDLVTISRTDGRTAVLRHSGQPERVMPLPRRTLSDLLAEELRRLDADEVYAEALSATTDVTGLAERPAQRTPVWFDPAKQGGVA